MSFHMTWRSLKGHWSGFECSFGSACCSAFHGTSVLQPVYLLPCLLHLANVWALTLGSPSEECGSYLRNTDGHEALSSCPPTLCTHCMYGFTLTSAYHCQFVVHNQKNPNSRHMEAGVKLVCQS